MNYLSFTVPSLLLLTCCVTHCSHAAKAPGLDRFLVDKAGLSVSGLSSGAYFAVQFHVAFSKTINGAGVIAGGPFWCAQDDVEIALHACMKTPAAISVAELVTITYITALSGTIDPPSHLSDDNVYLYSGTLDSVVAPGVMHKAAEYYATFIQSGHILSVFKIPSEHGIVTADYGNKCNDLGPPYILNCNYSSASALLRHIYGSDNVRPANSSLARRENLLEFDQSVFALGVPGAISLDTTGFVYVPTACQLKKKECRLHIAFHGCLQGRKYVSEVFAAHAGYNGVAELNDIIILYPQAVNSILNPKGCWDWWGYTSPAYASKLGPQMAAVKLMLDRAAGL